MTPFAKNHEIDPDTKSLPSFHPIVRFETHLEAHTDGQSVRECLSVLVVRNHKL